MKSRAKFDFCYFCGGKFCEFVVHANKFTKEEAMKLHAGETSETGLSEQSEPIKRWVKFYPQSPYWCSEDGGVYTYCNEGTRGAFPTWVFSKNYMEANNA